MTSEVLEAVLKVKPNGRSVISSEDMASKLLQAHLKVKSERLKYYEYGNPQHQEGSNYNRAPVCLIASDGIAMFDYLKKKGTARICRIRVEVSPLSFPGVDFKERDCNNEQE